MTDGLVQMLDGKTPKQLKTAYNNKYYPATAVVQVKYGNNSEGKIVDFSLYERYKIVGFTIFTKDQPQDYYGEIYNTLTEEEANELLEPILIKNVLVYEVQEGKVVVNVGSIDHPMVEEHYIEWVVVETSLNVLRKSLKAGEAPKVEFALLPEEKVEAVYAYCNLHGLWRA